MKIGIQISLGLKQRTGVKEYASQLVRHLMMLEQSKKHQFFLYTPHFTAFNASYSGQASKVLNWPFKIGWTQIRLSWAMLKDKVDVLFVPAHTFPLIHPKKVIVTIQGLEFEAVPKMYSFWQRVKLRFLTKRNIKKATKIIVPSESTKKDLLKFYPDLFKKNTNKIVVIPHGITSIENCKLKIENCSKYILYLGSNHKRKNVKRLEEAFEILKNKYLPTGDLPQGDNIPYELIIAGAKEQVSEEEKWKLLREADVFVFPSLYEGFGFPVLEAQSVGVPVVTSNVSSLPEIVQDSALLVNPNDSKEIAKAIYKLIINDKLKKEMIERGCKNIKRFNWPKCAEETLKIIT